MRRVPRGTIEKSDLSGREEATTRMRILAALALLFVWSQAGAQDVESLPPLPPLNEPASDLRLPGKVVWADLFTNDVDSARKFYEQVFGWEWREVTGEPQPYGLLYMGGQRVAGIVKMDPPEGESTFGRWVHFVSTDDIKKSASYIIDRGGEELLAPVTHANRGEFAIYAGPEDEVFGIIRSSSGDRADYQSRIGEWIWWQLFTSDVASSVDALQGLFGYEAETEQVLPDVAVVQLSAHGHARAVVAPLPPDPEAKATWVGFVRVDDIGQSVEKVVAAGGKVMLPPDPEILGGDIAVIADPVGTLLGVMRWDYPADEGGAQP